MRSGQSEKYPDKVASFLNAARNRELDLSERSVYGFCRKFAGASDVSIRHLEEKLRS